MTSNTLLSSLILFTMLSPMPSREQAVNVNDSLALVDLYNATGGSTWTRKQNWLSGPVSTWQGIQVTGSRVTSLYSASNNMVGSLPSSIGNLDELTFLDLSLNKLNGTIPASIGSLVNIIQLRLGSNSFTGSIPGSIGNLVNVIYLYMNSNQLSGAIPSSIGNLQSVAILDISSNDLSGSIPSSIGDLSNLYHLILSHNQLSGAIPASIGNLDNMEFLNLDDNQLSGNIPGSFGDLDKISGIALMNNQLSGMLPASIGNLLTLQTLRLSYNRLTGTLPATIRNLTNLVDLDVDNNLLGDTRYLDYPGFDRQTMQGDIENNHLTFNTCEFIARKFPRVTYYEQLNISIHQNGNTLSVSAGGKLSNNTYKWYKVGNTIPTVTAGDSTFDPSENGDYYAEITNAVATRLTLKTDTVSFTVPLATNKKDQKLSIYPNPVKNMLIVKGFDKIFTYSINIADMNGSMKLNATVKQQSAVQINVSSLKPGNYILYSTAGEKNVSVNFVKQ